jgi:uncharacterized membrane protein
MRTSLKLAVAAVLAAIQVILAVIGFTTVALPNGLNVSVLFLPSLVAGVLAGGLPGAAVGAVFGVTSLVLATAALFQNPVIAIVPRVLIGPTAALVFRSLRQKNEIVALALAGASGAIANTGLVLALATVVPGPAGAPYLAPDAALEIARTNIPIEAIAGALVATVISIAVRAMAARR